MIGLQLPAILAGNKRNSFPGFPEPNDGDRYPMDERMSIPGMPAFLSAQAAPEPMPTQPAAPAGPQVLDSQPASNVGPPSLSPSFDAKGEYDAILKQIEPAKKKFGVWDALQIIGPALQAFGGDQAGANQSLEMLGNRRREQTQSIRNLALQALKWRQEEFARRQDANADASKPFTIGRDRVQVDPTTGKATTVFHGPADFESYAGVMGYEPGTPAYRKAAEDFVLRGNGPSAMGYDMELDDHRTGNRLKLDGNRQAGRVALERLQQSGRTSLKGTPTYRDLNPPPPRSGGPRGATATDAKGNTIYFRNGAWVDAAGRSVQ